MSEMEMIKLKIIHFFGDNSEKVAEIVFGGTTELYDQNYGFIIRLRNMPLSFKGSLEDIILKYGNTITICLASHGKQTGAILCLKQFLEKEKINYEMIHLESTSVV